MEYRTTTGFKVFCWIMAVICAVLIVLLPFSVMLVVLAYRSRITITDEVLVVRWFGTRRIPWGEIASVRWARAAGLVGGLMRPITGELKNGRSFGNIAVGAHRGMAEILEEIRKRTGLAP
jgi:hypothetical protein